ncbi:hypothetical protein D3C81_1785940 [compost metagenome]
MSQRTRIDIHPSLLDTLFHGQRGISQHTRRLHGRDDMDKVVSHLLFTVGCVVIGHFFTDIQSAQ